MDVPIRPFSKQVYDPRCTCISATSKDAVHVNRLPIFPSLLKSSIINISMQGPVVCGAKAEAELTAML